MREIFSTRAAVPEHDEVLREARGEVNPPGKGYNVRNSEKWKEQAFNVLRIRQCHPWVFSLRFPRFPRFFFPYRAGAEALQPCRRAAAG